MGNCLVTKLKGSVANNNLSKLGVLKIKYSSSPTSGNIQIQYLSTPTQFKVFDANGVLLGTSYTTDEPTLVRFDYAAAQNISYIEVYDMYNIVAARVSPGNPIEISSCLSLQEVDMSWNSDININLTDLPETIERITIDGTSVAGNTGDISKFKNITHLYAQYVSTFTGSVEEFGETLFRNYTQDKEVLLSVANNITFRTVKVVDPTTYTFTITSSQVIVKEGNTTKATYDGSTWTYNS